MRISVCVTVLLEARPAPAPHPSLTHSLSLLLGIQFQVSKIN